MAKKNSNTPAISVEVRNNIAIVWLDRQSAYNALDEGMVDDLTTALQEIAEEPSLRAMILGGRGEAFCAGMDLKWMRRMGKASASANEKAALAVARLYHTLYNLPLPTIARVHGHCFAGGVGLVAACDIAVASMNADFGCTETKHGLVPAGIAPYFMRAVGPRLAQRYLLSGERFDAAEAYRIGLVQELCPPEELDGTINMLLGHVVATAPGAVRETKRLLHALRGVPIDESLVEQSAKRLAQMRTTE
ncbi:MAG: enoyl-CoA hydratase/isomerase family protein, partial [Burkholderiales bacterium]|nr:enoyl-CoA hydratase/isomerase family protein [Burkholderiales bacterium]